MAFDSETAREAGKKSSRKGIGNKSTAELKKSLKAIVDDELENIDRLLSSLDPKDRLDIVCKLLPYVLPKQTQLMTDGEVVNSVKIILEDYKSKENE